MIDAEYINNLVTTTTTLHERARARVTPPQDTLGDGMPGSSGFGPKVPLSAGMLSLADNLTANLHGLCELMWGMGVMPREHLPHLWRRRDFDGGIEVIGDDVTGEGIKHVAAYVRRTAPYIAGTPGIEWAVDRLEHVIGIGLGLFPQEDVKWVTVEEAERITGRSKATLYEWLKAGTVRVLNDNWGIMYHQEDLIRIVEEFNRGRVERAAIARAALNA